MTIYQEAISDIGRESMPRIAMLWANLPEYVHSCAMQLRSILGDNLWCASLGDPSSDNTRAKDPARVPLRVFSFGRNAKTVKNDILKDMEIFRPDAFFISGWQPDAVLSITRRLKETGILTVCIADTPWLGTFRQFTRCIIGRGVLSKSYDVMWVPGERAARLAHMAGFKGKFLWRNLLTSDSDVFSTGTQERLKDAKRIRRWPHRFIFVGRLSPEKNIEKLVKGYEIYRKNVSDPWDLWCLGEGPLRYALEDKDGIVCKGWRAGSDVASMMSASGCFILPSIYDAWGVAVHEAACAGLPLIISKNAGSCDELMREPYNGRRIDPQDPADIAGALRWVSEYREPWLLGAESYELSKKFSPRLWAGYIVWQVREALSERNVTKNA